MTSHPDLYSTAVCMLFLRVSHLFLDPGKSTELSEAASIDKHQPLRDCHWYIERLVEVWHEYKRRTIGTDFTPLPWFRRKSMCSKVLQTSSVAIVKELDNATGLYGEEDKRGLWDIIEQAIGPIGEREYANYEEKLSRAYRRIEQLRKQWGRR